MRRDCCAALAAVQLRGQWAPWLEWLGRAVIESCDESVSIAQDLLALAESREAKLSDYRVDSAARRHPAPTQ